MLTIGSDTETWDSNGNMASRTIGGITTNFFYDGENRPVSVGTAYGTVVAQYHYDPFGRRMWKNAGGAATYFMYADEGLIGEYDASGPEITSYGYKPGNTWGSDPLFMRQGGQFYFYQNDALGTPKMITSAAGAVVWSAVYDAFGQAQVGISIVTNNLRLPGQYYDAETGLHYNFQRYYDPTVGRFISEDPLGFGGGDVNLYTYTGNRPISLSDPSGLAAIDGSCKNSAAIEALLPIVEAKINSGCLPKELENCMLSKLANLSIKCWNDPNDRKAGWSIPGIGSGISLNEGNGGVDASVIFHEMIHKCWGDEKKAYGCTKKCFSPEITTGGAGGNPCNCK